MNERASLSGAEPVAVPAPSDPQALCAAALLHMLRHRGDPYAEVQRALAIDPGCAAAHGLRMALIVRADDESAQATVRESASAVEASHPEPSDPARRHAAAARAWAEGDAALALERYGAMVVDDPGDVVALALAHALDLRLGRRRMLRDRVAQVLPEWNADMPGYASVLAMYAFGLEENGQYRRAEKAAHRALAIDPGHPAAIHVVAHVLEMQGRPREGLAFLAATEPAWAHGTSFSVHLAWHKALFHLDADEPSEALGVYDAHIAIRRPDFNALADASALLWRLTLRDVDVGERWRAVADRWDDLPLESARSFFVMHACIAFAATGRTGNALRALALLPQAGEPGASETLLQEALLRPLCEGLLDFALGDYRSCVALLTHVRDRSDQCGGSLAQCDLVQLTFIEAAFRGHEAPLARALVAERMAQRPESPLNGTLQRRLRALSRAERAAGPIARGY